MTDITPLSDSDEQAIREKRYPSVWRYADDSCSSPLMLTAHEWLNEEAQAYDATYSDPCEALDPPDVRGDSATVLRELALDFNLLLSELTRLRDECKNLAKDKERLDRLQKLVMDTDAWHDLVLAWDGEDGFWLTHVERGIWVGEGPLNVEHAPDLRTAIDESLLTEEETPR